MNYCTKFSFLNLRSDAAPKMIIQKITIPNPLSIAGCRKSACLRRMNFIAIYRDVGGEA
jgi:hypothetical protein